MTPEPLWYKDAIIYQLHVKAFFDWDNDGIGDFRGLRSKLEYLHDLGVNALWLLPFYPSPLRDDGYDIADYRSINPSYGTLRDFRGFLREARRLGLRVITELVVNHTSDQHPWFQRARHAKPGSAARNFYVWSDTDQKYQGTRIIFTDTEKSNWAWDPVAKAYYWHRFFSHQPDLNFDNPRVVEAIIGVMRYWFDMGVDGMRLDAIPYLCEREGTSCENLPETHAVLRQLRAALDARYQNKMLLGEANQWPEDVLPYFGDGDECHMAFHFPLMPRMYMAVAQEDRHPITDIMRQTPEIPEICQWAIFLRNHDELTLEMVTDRERDYLWEFYAADRRARINLGIRRRLAPLLDNDRRKIELMNSLLMSMPGTPVIYYGDEIGMGDNVYLGDRDAVRTPMQWTPDRNAGFSRADPARLYLPAVMDPVYGFEARNVEAQTRDPSSLLNWVKRLIAARRQHAAFGRGGIRFLYPGNRKVLAYLREHEGESILCVANLSRAPQPVELDLCEFTGRVPVELLGRSSFPPIGELPYFVTLPGYGFYWFQLAEEAKAPSWHAAFSPSTPELLTLVAPKGWASLADGSARQTLEQRVLPEFLSSQRWFAGKGARIADVQQADRAMLDGWAYVIYEVTFGPDAKQLYALPQSIEWETDGEESLIGLLPWTIGRVRQGPRVGILYDAAGDSDFVRAVVEQMRRGKDMVTERGGRLRFSASPALATVEGLDALTALDVRPLGHEQSNTSLRVGEELVLKLYRRLQSGIHPEVEIGRHLTEVASFRNMPALMGVLEIENPDGKRTALAVLQQYVLNQGDGWRQALDYLDRELDEATLTAFEGEAGGHPDRHGGYLTLARILGRRTADLHRAFAVPTDDPAFRPQPVRRTDIERWRRRGLRQLDLALKALRRARRNLTGGVREECDRLIGLRKTLRGRLESLLPDTLDVAKTRYHGDFHLGQVIVAQNDYYILDFEGEPARSLAERREKGSPLRDVAGMLRSFDYAAWASVFDRPGIRADLTDVMLRWTLTWRDQASTAFLDGYREAAAGCPSCPEDSDLFRDLVAFFTLEKACYEICYEADNRPDWLRIPIRGALDLLEQQSAAKPT